MRTDTITLSDGRDVAVGRLRFGGASPVLAALGAEEQLSASLLALLTSDEPPETGAAFLITAQAFPFLRPFVFFSTTVDTGEDGDLVGADIQDLPLEDALTLCTAVLAANPLKEIAGVCRRFFAQAVRPQRRGLMALLRNLPKTAGNSSARRSSASTTGPNETS